MAIRFNARENVILTSDGNKLIIDGGAVEASVGLTADAGSSQGDGPITNSYNVYTTVATTGDAATLPATFDVGTLIYIKNDGANSMDVFPASGDDAGAGVDTAIAVPAGESRTFIATLTDSTWTTLIAPGGGGGGGVSASGTPVDNQIAVWTDASTIEGDTNLTWDGSQFVMLPDGSGAAPVLGIGAANYGLFKGSTYVSVALAGVEHWRLHPTSIQNIANGGGILIAETPSTSNPTLAPSNADVDTGIGYAGSGQISLIGDGVEKARAGGAAGANQFLVHAGTEGNPGLSWLADTDTGIYRTSSGSAIFSSNGSSIWSWTGTSVGISSSGLDSARILIQNPSATAPVYILRSTDTDTGIGSAAADQVSVIAGGVEAIRLTEASSAVIQTNQSNVGLTADAGSSQGDGPIISTYNVYSTVATTGDAATLPSTFAVGTLIYIKNDGANSMDVFPASGDDAGAGVDTAVAIASGDFAVFLATVADSTWTRILAGTA